MTTSRRTALSLLPAAAALALGAQPAAATAPRAGSARGRGRRHPAILVSGDSTAATYAAHEAPRAGWGQALEVFLPPVVAVRNHAWSGASTKSFADSGRLDRLLAEVCEGDVVLVSFGHNDSKQEDPARYTDPWGTYQQHLARFADGARARGGVPVVVTPVERRRFDADGRARESHGDYPAAARALAAREGIALVDLTALSLQLWNSLGPDGTTSAFLHLAPGESANHPAGVVDNTHFRAAGAIELARTVASELDRQRIVRPGTVVGLHRQHVPEDALTWPAQRPAEVAPPAALP
ncbi:rhamnogalacturonan acetylesterase [Kineococcus glutinatus]|uniref:Rhamnogalacturonan acetylesterase n=1 Tax=Kineococcus glutinatus TaxID=1070872 RepID=A0ABP9HPR2_9ACTN